MIRLTRRRLIAIVSVLVLLAAGAGYAVYRGTAFDLAATAARLDALIVRINGSVAEQRANELLNYHRVEGGMANCMRERGLPYTVAPYFSLYEGFTDADVGYGTGGATVLDSVTEHGRRFALNVIASAYAPPGYDYGLPLLPPGVDQETWIAASNACRGPFDYREYHDTDRPAGTDQLSSLPGLSERIDANPLVLAGRLLYAPCMRERGHQVDWNGRDDFLFRDWGLRTADAPISGRPATAAWRAAEDEMTGVFADDAACRMPSYTAAMRLVSWWLDEWEAAHRADLDLVRAEWRRRAAEAERLTSQIAVTATPRPSPPAR
ncbi:hypothetical protein ACFQY4_07935 [Catellatospora bangladeshensis]|uniref:Uncharacterized protein n=1 Tax=Catellatospora bangladeshensis TaxID=310355 RepID=A0A8J3J628_9ACTN|nr:hypothetical protein [Catellatospora bangladeshensis]GIF78782.1 hypothetical protein Cba03nite_01310 [Catellatospora bangladeshensis]